jgi:uncharacterized protein YndB with AHSA1/START domain
VTPNGKPPVKSTAQIDIEAPPQLVWEVVTTFENWPNWNPEVKSMSFAGPLAPGSEFRWKAGPGTIVSTLDRIEPPNYIAWRGRTLTIHAYHEWWLEPRDGGTHVRTEESYSGLLARLLRGTLQKTLDKSLEDGLQRLKWEAERQMASGP